MIKYVRWIRPASGRQKCAALANKKQEKFDHICADNLIKRSGTRINRKECTVKNFVFRSRGIWKFRKVPRTLIRSRSLHACSNPSHDPVPLSNVTFKHLSKTVNWALREKALFYEEKIYKIFVYTIWGTVRYGIRHLSICRYSFTQSRSKYLERLVCKTGVLPGVLPTTTLWGTWTSPPSPPSEQRGK